MSATSESASLGPYKRLVYQVEGHEGLTSALYLRADGDQDMVVVTTLPVSTLSKLLALTKRSTVTEIEDGREVSTTSALARYRRYRVTNTDFYENLVSSDAPVATDDTDLFDPRADYKAQRPPLKSWQREIDESLREYDLRQEEAANRPLVDEDGFQLVVSRKSGKKRARADGAAPAAKAVRARHTAPRAAKALDDFYRFQREKKRDEQVALVQQRFERDKRRLEKLKNQRKFKPL